MLRMAHNNSSKAKIKARRIIERIKYLTDNITMIAENRRKWGWKNGRK